MAKKKPVRKKKGRTFYIDLDWKVIDEKLQAGMNGREVASHLGIHENSLYTRTEKEKKKSFATYAAEMRSHGDGNLREKHYKLALAGNVRFLESLCRERLGFGKEQINVTVEMESAFKEVMEYFRTIQLKKII